MRTRFVLLIAFILTLTLTCSEAGSKKQASRNARVDLKELEKKFIGKLYVTSGTSVPSHLNGLQVSLF